MQPTVNDQLAAQVREPRDKQKTPCGKDPKQPSF